MSSTERFWEGKTLAELADTLTNEQWESLCDGCGRCCMHKLEDEDTGTVHYTDVACKLLNTETCVCKHYKTRLEHVPDCLTVRPLSQEKMNWLPASCAYVKLYKGEPLADWHPLISGSGDSVRQAGVAMTGRCRSENEVPVSEWPMHLISLAD